MNQDHRRTLDDITQDVDLLVFQLEAAPAPPDPEWMGERAALLRELERFRDRLNDLLNAID
ncbi:MAG: hypothetical protein AB8H79_14320 [Myxococcota bacterium]